MIVENIEDKALLNIELNDGIGTDKEIIGTFVKNTAKLSIQNVNHQYDNLKDKYISIKNFGSWFVYDLVNDEDATEAQLSLYDISNKFDKEYNAELYSFPCTFGEWATKIGETVGVPLEGTFLNYNLELKEAPFLGTNPSNRDAVKFIAKYASGYAQINSNDTYSIRWFDKTIYEIEDWEGFVHGNESNEVNTVVLSTGDNECWPQVKLKEPHEIKIIDDWTNIDRTKIIEGIYNQLKGFKYTPITKLDVPYGLLELRAGQMIKAQDIELKYITTYISGHTLKWDGGDFDDPNSWSSSIKMMEISETSTKYSYSGSVIDRITRTERTVDKQNQIIKDVVESTDEAVSKVNEFEMSLDGIKMSVDETNNKFDKEITSKKNAFGNPIEIDDAGEYYLESIAIEGKSVKVNDEIKTVQGKEFEGKKGKWLEQVTYNKNNAIFDESYKNNTYTYNEFREDSISVVKNSTGGTFYAKYKLDIREAGDYIISSDSNIQHQLYVYTDALWGNLVKWVYTGKEQEITFSNVGTYVLGVFANSSTTGKEFQLNNLMVRKKEIEDSSYVKYEKNSALIDMNKDNKFDGELEIGNIDNGINLNATNTYRSKNYLKIKPNTIYSFYLNKKLHRVLISFYDKDKNYINTSAVGLETKGIINSMSNAEFLRFRCYGDDKSLFENSLIEIYEGIDRYYEFAQIDEVKDIFDNGKLTKNIEKYVVSSNVIGIQDTYTNVTYAKIPKPINSANYGNYSNTSVLFTHATFKVKTWSSWDTTETIDVISSNASSNEYWIGFPKGTTLDEMKTKLDGAILYHRLKESQIYELSYEQLKLHKGYNYITLNDILYPYMEIKYLTDSILNATYETRAEHRIENDKIISKLNSKVSDNELGEVVTEINNTFEQKISDSEVSTMSSINAKFKNYSNTTEMNNAINQKVTESENSINLSVSQKIENIQIGGTNLLPGSQLLDSDKITIKNALKQNDYKDFNSASGYSTSATYIDVLKWNEVLIPESSKEYTLSFYAKKYPQVTTGKVTTYFFPNCVAEGITSQGVKTTAADGVVNFNLTNEWKRYWVTYKTLANVSGAKNILFRAFKNYGSSICGVKLEEGNKASDWSPAPEDMATNKSVEASLELKVGRNENDQVVSMLNAAADEINLKGGSKINITTAGKLIISAGNFQLDEEGSMTAVNGTFTGTINATSGNVGNFEITDDYLASDVEYNGYIYRTYIQKFLTDAAHRLNTWGFSLQRYKKGSEFGEGIFTVDYNGKIDGILPIEYYSYKSGEVSLASGAYDWTAEGISLPKGNYIIFVEVVFGSNKNGIRAANLSITKKYATPQVTVNAVNGASTRIYYAVPVVISNNNLTYLINAYQNSGSNLSVWANMYIYKLTRK